MARLLVEGSSRTISLPPATSLSRYHSQTPITDEELAQHGGHQRNLLMMFARTNNAQLPQPLPAGEAWYIPDGDAAPANFKNFAYVAGSDGSTGRAAPFQSALTQSQTVPLNAVEEWTVYNRNAYPHPFHIHINHICVVRINGEPVEPFWADTIPLPPNGNITFRSCVTDFTGAFVWHCHALDHEDLGMMRLVEVV